MAPLGKANANVRTQLAIVQSAASKYRIPWPILWGVYGAETGHGTDITTSSAGAKGAFQFIPETANAYHYPYTNSYSQEIFTQQANAAAHYLSDLYRESGGHWDTAIKRYSGGGYGLSHVESNAEQGLLGDLKEQAEQYLNPFGPDTKWQKELNKQGSEVTSRAGNVLHTAEKTVEGAAKGVSTTAELAGKIGEWLDEPLKPLKLVGGGILLYLGLRTLTRTGGTNVVVGESQRAGSHLRQAAETVAPPTIKLASKAKG